MTGRWVVRYAGLLVIMTPLLGGCNFLKDVGRSTVGLFTDQDDYRAEYAWNVIYSQKETAGGVNNIAGTRESDIAARLLAKEYNEAERRSSNPGIPNKAVQEIVDEMSGYLVTELPNAQGVADAEWRMTLALGCLVNRSGDHALTTALKQVESRLNQNSTFKKHFYILSSDETEAERVIEDLSGSHPHDIYEPDSLEDTGVRKVHPEDLYVLTGVTDVFKEQEGLVPTIRFVSTVTVIHPKNRSQILSKDFVNTYYYHPTRKKYISEATNNSLKSGLEDE